jgi:hypothetical protein
VPAAEAKNVDDASIDTLRATRPPDVTGRLACVHCSSVSAMLQILVTADLIKSSNCRSRGYHNTATTEAFVVIFDRPSSSSTELGHHVKTLA